MSGGLLTTTIGSFPKPDYLQKARNQYRSGKLSREDLAELERKATREVMALQEELGLDVLVDGEMDRGDMVEAFAERLPGWGISGLVRSYGNRYYHKPVIKDRLSWPGPVTVEMWQFAQGLTQKPVKGMLTGPYTMVEWSFDEHYGSRRDAVLAMAEVLHSEALELERAGALYIQIDEPALHTRPDEDLEVAIDAVGVVAQGLKAKTVLHVCYGDVERIYPDMLRLAVDEINMAFKNSDFRLLDLLRREAGSPFGGKILGLGVLDVHNHGVETADEVKEGIRQALDLLPPERLTINPDCGLKTRTWDQAREKLAVMVEAARQVKHERGME